MGLFDFNKRSKSAINKDRKYFNANEPHEVGYAKFTKRHKKTYNTFDNGGIMKQDKDNILNWFYSLDNERQNDLMNEADSDPADEKFYMYLIEHFGESIQKYKLNNRFKDGGGVGELKYWDVYDDETGKTLQINASTLEDAILHSEEIDFNDYKDGEKIDLFDWFWNYDYRHYMRSASYKQRKEVKDKFIKEGLKLDGSSPKHAYIVVSTVKPEELKHFKKIGENAIEYSNGGGVYAKGGMIVYLDGKKAETFKTKKSLYDFVRKQTEGNVKKVEIDYGNRIIPTFDTYIIENGKLIHKGELIQPNIDKEEVERKRVETERNINKMMGYSKGGGVGDKFKAGDFVFAKANRFDTRKDESSKIPFFVSHWSHDKYYILGDGSHYISEDELTPATEKDFNDYYGENASEKYKHILKNGGGVGRIKVGTFDEAQLKKGEDKKATKKAQKESGLTYTDTKIIKKGGKMYLEVYLIPNDEYYKSSKFSNGGGVGEIITKYAVFVNDTNGRDENVAETDTLEEADVIFENSKTDTDYARIEKIRYKNYGTDEQEAMDETDVIKSYYSEDEDEMKNGGGVGVAKISKKGKTVTLESGMKGNRNLLQNRYDSLEEFEAISEIYGLHRTLGYDTPEEAWIDNPIIESGVIPSDFRKVSKYYKGGRLGKTHTKYPKFSYNYGGQLTDENTVRENLHNGEIHINDLQEIVGCELKYPYQYVGGIKLEKCFLRPYYRIIN